MIPHLPPITIQVDDISDEGRFPNIADASLWLRSLSDERRDELNKEWNGE